MNVSPADVEAFVRANAPEFQTREIPIGDIEFELRTELLCFYCARYNNKWTCPPRIPRCDYKKMFSEYEHAMLVYNQTEVGGDYEDSRYNSSVRLHKTLLSIENFLLSRGNSMRVSFIGGSCKLCRNGCAPDRCRSPYQARIPLEATGTNVIKTAAKVGIEIKFPATESITRIGLILW